MPIDFVFHNQFPDASEVYLVNTKGIKVLLDKGTRGYMGDITSDWSQFRYIVDGVVKCLETKPISTNQHGEKYNYIKYHYNNYSVLKTCLKECANLGDIDAIYYFASVQFIDCSYWNPDEYAVECMKTCVEKGFTHCAADLGHYYFKNNTELSIYYYNKYITYLDTKHESDTKYESDSLYITALLRLGYLYKAKLKNYEKSLEYYKLASENGSLIAFCYMGDYYQYIEHDYEKMLKMYESIFAAKDIIDYNSNILYDYKCAYYYMNYQLGKYHQYITKNYTEMMKYYSNVLAKPFSKSYNLKAMAHYHLGIYYYFVENKYENAFNEWVHPDIWLNDENGHKKQKMQYKFVYLTSLYFGESPIDYSDKCVNNIYEHTPVAFITDDFALKNYY